MTDYFASSGLFAWLMENLRAIAGLRTPFMNTAMSGVTVLGEEMAFIVVGLLIFWCFDRRFGYKFLFMYISGTFLNQLVKAIFMIPRPWVIDPDFKIVESARAGATGWSFPSGHVQSATVMYGGIARRLKKAWAYVIACIVILLVGFSRMYLGVHTLLDVAVALLLGLLTLAVCGALFEKFSSPKAYSVMSGIVALLCLGLVIFVAVTLPGGDETGALKDACVLFGTAFGLFAGSFVEMRFVKFETKAAWWAQIIKAVLGLGIIIGLRVALKSLLGLISDSPFMDCARYFIMCFVAIAVYPLLFRLFARTAKKA